MNIVDLIKSQLTDAVLGKLGSLIGESEQSTKTAVSAAVPGLLSILANLASTSGGAERVINSLKQVQQEIPDTHGGLGDILSGGQAPAIQEKGSSILHVLLGSATLPAILSLVGNFARISPGAVKGLLGFLAPLVLSMISKQFAGRSLTAQGLSSFFAEQKGNISSAMPAGFSLANIPGFSSAAPVARAVSSPTKVEGGMPSWLLPLVGLAVLGALAWWFLSQPQEPVAQVAPVNNAAPRSVPATDSGPKVADPVKKIEIAPPDAVKVGADLGDFYTQLTDLLAGVKDVPTAETTATKLTDLTTKVDGLKLLWDKLPDSARATVAKVTTDHLAKLKELVAKVLALPGVSEKLKPVLDSMVGKLALFAVS
jgi:hypothetical protein